jgi:hypothetical protein
METIRCTPRPRCTECATGPSRCRTRVRRRWRGSGWQNKSKQATRAAAYERRQQKRTTRHHSAPTTTERKLVTYATPWLVKGGSRAQAFSNNNHHPPLANDTTTPRWQQHDACNSRLRLTRWIGGGMVQPGSVDKLRPLAHSQGMRADRRPHTHMRPHQRPKAAHKHAAAAKTAKPACTRGGNTRTPREPPQQQDTGWHCVWCQHTRTHTHTHARRNATCTMQHCALLTHMHKLHMQTLCTRGVADAPRPARGGTGLGTHSTA